MKGSYTLMVYLLKIWCCKNMSLPTMLRSNTLIFYTMQYKKLTRILNIINLIMSIMILISSVMSYRAWMETQENMRMYACDGWAYDQEHAPEYCKFPGYGK